MSVTMREGLTTTLPTDWAVLVVAFSTKRQSISRKL